MANKKDSPKPQGWTLFDYIVNERARVQSDNPWSRGGDGSVSYVPDYELLRLLLRVPEFLGSSSTSGIPALAIDVWVASELRRAGFERDSVWPRAEVPRILPGPFSKLLGELNQKDAQQLRAILSNGKTYNGAVGASARVMGKNYMKQVDVVMSDWDTGPELLISTKRMDRSFGNNAPNRVEESYGDAKNLRSRHPLAALGFVFALRSDAFVEAPKVAAWIVDLLGKLGREEDAYDSVLLLVPSFTTSVPAQGEESTEGIDDLIEAELVPPQDDDGIPLSSADEAERLYNELLAHPPVELSLGDVPAELSAERFFDSMARRILNNSPITRHIDARDKLAGV